MRPKQKTYYCQNHHWVMGNPCLVCDNPTREFERRGGVYYVADVDHPLPSVTQVLQVLAKPALITWAARESAKFAYEHPTASLEEATAVIYSQKKEAGKRGGSIHDLILEEKFEEIPESLKGYIDAYKKFRDSMPHEIVLKEKIVYSQNYAGRFDAYIKMGDRFGIIDYKSTKSGLFSEVGLQLSAYKHAISMEPGVGKVGMPWDKPVDFLMGVHLKSDGTFATREYQDDFKVFESCLKIYQWQNQ